MLIVLHYILGGAYQPNAGDEKDKPQYQAGRNNFYVVSAATMVDKVKCANSQANYSK